VRTHNVISYHILPFRVNKPFWQIHKYIKLFDSHYGAENIVNCKLIIQSIMNRRNIPNLVGGHVVKTGKVVCPSFPAATIWVDKTVKDWTHVQHPSMTSASCVHHSSNSFSFSTLPQTDLDSKANLKWLKSFLHAGVKIN